MWKNVASQGAVRAQTRPMPADATAAITATSRTDWASSVWAMRANDSSIFCGPMIDRNKASMSARLRLVMIR